MDHHTRTRPPVVGKKRKHDFNVVARVYDSVGLRVPLDLQKASAAELAIIRAALAQADKARSAAWDPGAAYMSGVLDVLLAVRSQPPTEVQKIRSPRSTLGN